MNRSPAWAAMDASPGADCADANDRVRGFFSLHASGSNFAFGDQSTKFISQAIDLELYRGLSTVDGDEIVGEDY